MGGRAVVACLAWLAVGTDFKRPKSTYHHRHDGATLLCSARSAPPPSPSHTLDTLHILDHHPLYISLTSRCPASPSPLRPSLSPPPPKPPAISPISQLSHTVPPTGNQIPSTHTPHASLPTTRRLIKPPPFAKRRPRALGRSRVLAEQRAAATEQEALHHKREREIDVVGAKPKKAPTTCFTGTRPTWTLQSTAVDLGRTRRETRVHGLHPLLLLLLLLLLICTHAHTVTNVER